MLFRIEFNPNRDNFFPRQIIAPGPGSGLKNRIRIHKLIESASNPDPDIQPWQWFSFDKTTSTAVSKKRGQIS
jgi:hypothetical protein